MKSIIIGTITVFIIVSLGFFYYKSLNNKIIELENSNQQYKNRIQELENNQNAENLKNEEQAKNYQNELDNINLKIECAELKRKTPDFGPGEYINIDIVGYYNYVKSQLKEAEKDPKKDENTKADLSFWKKAVDQATPLYNNYINKCDVLN
jgi:hypothetical protein